MTEGVDPFIIFDADWPGAPPLAAAPCSADLSSGSSTTTLKVLGEGLRSPDLSRCICVANVSALAFCPALQVLKLRRLLRLADVSALASLSELQSLDLSGCAALVDATPLAGCVSLRDLDFSGCEGD